MLRSATRIALIREGLADYSRNPLLGGGPDRFSFLPTNVVQPHNQIVQMLTDWGWIGSASFLMLLLNWFGMSWQRLRGQQDFVARSVRVGALGGLCISVLYSTVDGVLYFAVPSFLAALCLAIATLPDRTPDSIPNPHSNPKPNPHTKPNPDSKLDTPPES
jgi:hypothetical protein